MSQDPVKILTLSDHPITPSGVAIQTRYMIEGLLEKYPGKYQFVSLGGGKSHEDYTPIVPTGNEDEWVVYPVDGYGDPMHVRSAIRSEKPDMLWFMTDPRFYEWLWKMEDEIRCNVPMVYNNIWDNKPYPHFNNIYYESTDVLVSISELTKDINETVAPDVTNYHIPHAIDTSTYRPRSRSEMQKFKEQEFWDPMRGKFVFLFNGRNCRRKQTASMIEWFGEFLEKEEAHDDAVLLMHTEPHDENGPNLKRCASDWELDSGQVIFSTEKVPPDSLSRVYNASDCLLQISDAEGFGLPVAEALACETPVIGTRTGGIQDQIQDGESGILIEPSSQMVVGSQRVPYIYEDRISKDDFLDAASKMYNMPDSERREMGEAGKKFVRENFDMSTYIDRWDTVFSETYKKHGSWPNEMYDRWIFEEVA